MKKAIDIESYHADPAISKSKLDLINKSIFHYLNPVKYESESLDFGSAMHDSILLPEVFAKKYIQLPEDYDGRKAAGKALARQCEELGQIAIKYHDYKGILSIRERLLKTPIIRNMLEKSEKEMSYFTQMKAHGHTFDVRCRFDFRLGSDAMDFKTTRSTNEQDLKWTIKKYRYAVQNAWYSDVYKAETGEEIKNFIFIFIENKFPYHVTIKLLDRESEDLGRKHYLADLKTLAHHRDNPEAYLELKIDTIGLPSSSFFEETA